MRLAVLSRHRCRRSTQTTRRLGIVDIVEIVVVAVVLPRGGMGHQLVDAMGRDLGVVGTDLGRHHDLMAQQVAGRPDVGVAHDESTVENLHVDGGLDVSERGFQRFHGGKALCDLLQLDLIRTQVVGIGSDQTMDVGGDVFVRHLI